MSAPLCTVTPLEALHRLIGAASMIDANECKDETIYNVLQGEIAVACRVAKDLAAAPVVPVAAQPVVPEGWKLVPEAPTPKMVDATWNDSLDGMSHNARNKKIYGAMLAAAPQPAASVTDVAKKAARYDWLRSTGKEQLNVMAHYAGEEMDRAIDAAIAAQQGEKTK